MSDDEALQQGVARARPTPEIPRSSYLAAAIGAVAGGYLRVGLGTLPETGSASSWPWVTFGVNIAGTFVLALTVMLLLVRGRATSLVRPLVGTGFCGTLTTFSTLQLEVFRMLRAGNWLLASAYVAASVLAGLLAVVIGEALVRRWHAQ